MKLVYLYCSLVVLFVATSLFPVSPDEENLGIVVKENRFNIQYIDVCVSNYTPTQKPETATAGQPSDQTGSSLENEPFYKLMKSANQADFNGALWYYQANYSFANKNLQEARMVIREMFKLCLEKELHTTRAILEYAAPSIVRSNDVVAKNLLKLGFRELKSAENSYTEALNYAPYTHRKKTVLYFEGIEAARKGGRFAILAAIASRTPNEDKEEYRFIDLDEAKRSINEIKISEYKRIHNLLTTYTQNNLLDRKITPVSGQDKTPVDIFEKHDDNYRIITSGKVSLLDESSKKMQATDALEKESLPQRPEGK